MAAMVDREVPKSIDVVLSVAAEEAAAMVVVGEVMAGVVATTLEDVIGADEDFV